MVCSHVSNVQGFKVEGFYTLALVSIALAKSGLLPRPCPSAMLDGTEIKQFTLWKPICRAVDIDGESLRLLPHQKVSIRVSQEVSSLATLKL
jgi:hypothetical protein